MISLISKWKLRAGCPPELEAALARLAAAVERDEPGTWMYSVHLPAAEPLGADGQPVSPPPEPVARANCSELVFFEVYADAEAFAQHVHGPLFTRFREQYLKHFYENPALEGWPLTENSSLERSAAFVREAAR